MICQRFHGIQAACKAGTLYGGNAHITNGVYQCCGMLAALICQVEEIVPFRMPDQYDGGSRFRLGIRPSLQAARQTA